MIVELEKKATESKGQKVNILIEATLIEGCIIDDIKSADILCCENATIKHTQVIISPVQHVSTKEAILKELMNRFVYRTPFTEDEIRSKSRNRDLVNCRFLAFKVLCDTGLFSLKEVGEYFGGRDHTSVIHGKRQAKSMIEIQDELFMKLWEDIDPYTIYKTYQA